MIDVRTYGAVPDGTTDCAAAINAALLAGDIIIQNGVFLITESIKIPSNRTVYGKSAKLKLADNSFDNLFRNADFVNGNANVNIIGLGNFALDCNGTNNDDGNYTTYGLYGENSYKYVGIQIYKTTGFQLKNFSFIDTPHHSIHINKSGGSVGNHSIIDNIYFNYKLQLVNQDGLDICWGSHYIDVSNLSGNTDDDFTYMGVGVQAAMLADRSTGFNVGDIHDINFSNYLAKKTLVGRLPSFIAGNGNKIYNINMLNMKALSSGAFLFSNYGEAYSGTPPTVDDFYNITGDNIEVNSIPYDDAVFVFGQSMKDSTFTNVVNNSGKPMTSKVAGTQQNVSINGTII